MNNFATWFAVLGGAAGFASLVITLLRSKGGPAVIEPARPAAPAPVAASAAAAPAPAPAPAPRIDESIPGEVMALIAAAVTMTVGPRARIAGVVPSHAPSHELLQQWSVEGRRQIYSSHQIR